MRHYDHEQQLCRMWFRSVNYSPNNFFFHFEYGMCVAHRNSFLSYMKFDCQMCGYSIHFCFLKIISIKSTLRFVRCLCTCVFVSLKLKMRIGSTTRTTITSQRWHKHTYKHMQRLCDRGKDQCETIRKNHRWKITNCDINTSNWKF